MAQSVVSCTYVKLFSVFSYSVRYVYNLNDGYTTMMATALRRKVLMEDTKY